MSRLAAVADRHQSAQAIVDALSVAIRRPVLLDDPSLTPLAYSRQWGALDGVRRSSILARGPPPGVRDALMAQGIAEAVDMVRTTANPALGMTERVCVPVRASGRLLGYIWLVDAEATLSDEDLDRARSAAQRVATLLTESSTRSADDKEALLVKLVSQVLEERQVAVAEIRAQGALPDGPVVMSLLAGMTNDVDPVGAAHQAVRRLSVNSAIAGRAGIGAAVVASLGDPVLRTLNSGEVAQWLHTTSRVAVAVGQSASAPLDELHHAARHAGIALLVARSQPATRSFAAWSTLGAERLIAQLPGGWRDDVPYVLTAFIHDHPALAETLTAFLESGGDVKATAQATSLHRSGVYYRLRRIEELTGLHLDRGDDRLLAHLVLRAERLF